MSLKLCLDAFTLLVLSFLTSLMKISPLMEKAIKLPLGETAYSSAPEVKLLFSYASNLSSALISTLILLTALVAVFNK